VRVLKLPRVQPSQVPLTAGRVQFRDAGFAPKLSGDSLTLGPEQLAVVGFGEYAEPKYDLGLQADVVIPQRIRKLDAQFVRDGTNSVAASLTSAKGASPSHCVSPIADGKPMRSSRGAPPNGTSLAKILQIQVMQENRRVTVATDYDKRFGAGYPGVWGK